MTFLANIEETLDALITHQTMLNHLREKKTLFLEQETLEKIIDSLSARLYFLKEQSPPLVSDSTRGLRYRIKTKAHRLQNLTPQKSSPLNKLLSFLSPQTRISKKRLPKKAHS